MKNNSKFRHGASGYLRLTLRIALRGVTLLQPKSAATVPRVRFLANVTNNPDELP